MSEEPHGSQRSESPTAPLSSRTGRPIVYGGHPTFGRGLYARMLDGEASMTTALLRAATGIGSLLFGTGVWVRGQLYDRELPPCGTHPGAIPVISVGNLSVGGTGKSLAAIAIAREVLSLGRRPAIVARGYKAGSGTADEAQEQQARLGEGVPVFCDPDRRTGVATAAAAGAHVAILDDGFQHRRLRRDVDLLCIDLLDPPGARHLLPLGLLREPVSAARRAHAVLLTRADVASERIADDWRRRLRAVDFQGLIATAAHQPRSLVSIDPSHSRRSPEELRGAHVVLVSGVGNPRGFEASVRAQGAIVEAHFAFPDHHRYGLRDVESLRRVVASSRGAMLVTTGKDAVKLAPLFDSDSLWVLEVDLEILTGGDELRALLEGVCAQAGTGAVPAT